MSVTFNKPTIYLFPFMARGDGQRARLVGVKIAKNMKVPPPGSSLVVDILIRRMYGGGVVRHRAICVGTIVSVDWTQPYAYRVQFDGLSTTPCVDLNPDLQVPHGQDLGEDEEWHVRPVNGIGEDCQPGFFWMELDGEVCPQCLMRSPEPVCPVCKRQVVHRVRTRSSGPLP